MLQPWELLSEKVQMLQIGSWSLTFQCTQDETCQWRPSPQRVAEKWNIAQNTNLKPTDKELEFKGKGWEHECFSKASLLIRRYQRNVPSVHVKTANKTEFLSFTQFLCMKTFVGKVVGKLSISQTIHTFWRASWPFNLTSWPNMTHPLENANLTYYCHSDSNNNMHIS